MTESDNHELQTQPTAAEIYSQKVGPVPKEVIEFFGEDSVANTEGMMATFDYFMTASSQQNPFSTVKEIRVQFPDMPPQEVDLLERVAFRHGTPSIRDVRRMSSLADDSIFYWAMNLKDSLGGRIISTLETVKNIARSNKKDLESEFKYSPEKVVEREGRLADCACVVTDARPLSLMSAALQLSQTYTEDQGQLSQAERKSALDFITGREPSKKTKVPTEIAKKLMDINNTQVIVRALESMAQEANTAGEAAYKDLLTIMGDHVLATGLTGINILAELKERLDQAELDDETALLIENYISVRADMIAPGIEATFPNVLTNNEKVAAQMDILASRPYSSKLAKQAEHEQQEEVRLMDRRLADARNILLGGRRLGTKKNRKQVEQTADSLKALTSPKDAKVTLFTTEECGIVMSVILDKFFDFLELQTVDFDNDPAAKSLTSARFETMLELRQFDLLTALDNIRQVISETLSVQKLYGILTDQQIQKLKDVMIDEATEAAS